MTKAEKVLKKMGLKAEAPQKKVAGKKQAPKEMSSREKILKHCEVVKEPMQKGNVLIFGKHKYRINKLLADHTDHECDRVLKNLNEQFGVEKKVAAGKKPNRTKTTITVDPKPCECGCKGITRVGSKFLPGHDMKLKSKLRKAGTPASKKELKARGWK